MKHRPMIVGFACVLCAGVVAAAEPGLDLPAAGIPGGKPGAMMHGYWLRQADQAAKRWQEEYEARKTPAQIAAYQARLRGKFLEAIGGLPERTPLNAQVTGTIQRDGYRVEKVIFESQPKHFVTALLFRPDSDRKMPPCPGVLVPCGHSKNGKGSDAYQTMGALLALNGMAALVVDPIDQGERGQYLGRAVGPSAGASKPTTWSASAARSWAATPRGSRSGTTCGRSTTCSRGRRSIPSGSAAPAIAAGARRPAT